MKYLLILLVGVCLLLTSIPAKADQAEDVQAIIDEYCRLEGIDLSTQAKLMTDDRIMINPGRRQTDQATNMKIQIAGEKLNKKLDPGAQLIVTAVDPIIRIYGDAAVASFYRYWNLIPSAEYVKENPGNVSIAPPPNIMTLIMVKQSGAWKIAHTHMSPLHPSN